MKYFFAVLLFLVVHSIWAQNQILPLYEYQAIPNAIPFVDEEKSEVGDDGILRISKVSIPTLSVYLPELSKATGKAVIICPGGGYWILAAGHEGKDVAEALVEKGIAAFVLKYRLPSDQTMKDKSIGPLQDAQRAIQMVRANADEWGINPQKIGIMGFSAGGHLAATAGTLWEEAQIPNPDQISLRPDFMVLIYPVISFDSKIGHIGSYRNLLGENADEGLIEKFSLEKQAHEHTPPAYLVHAKDDGISIQNSIIFESALKENGIEVGSTYFESGGHGFGMVNPESEVLWLDEVAKWLHELFRM